MKYPIKSKEGFPILTVDDGAIPLHGIKELFALSSEDQINLCCKLGITFINDRIVTLFTETGKAYADTNNDRSTTDEIETQYCCNLMFRTEVNNETFPLKILIKLDDCTCQPYVNFLGEIRFHNFKNDEVVVPLVGRGTASLDGKVNDAHAGLCISGTCASFQERVAILSCILACFELSRDDIEIWRAHLLKICNKYLGIEDLLSYTIDKAFSLTFASYFDYMKNLYEDKEDNEIPIMLNHFIEFGEPHPLYFYELSMQFTKEEIETEFQSFSYGSDKQIVCSKVKQIINKFILYDNIFLLKPYGDNFEISCGDENISIYDVANELNFNSLEKSLKILSKLGFMIDTDKISIEFKAFNNNLIFSNKDIETSKNKYDKIFQINLKRKSEDLDDLLKLKILLNIDPIDNVNFLGKIEIRHSFFNKIVIPLVGRGTISLEGSSKDVMKSFCIDGNCASFLQRVAILYNALILLNVDSTDIQIFENKIKHINKKYYGTPRILDYIFKVSNGNETDSYFEFVKRKTSMEYSEMPIVMKTILTYNRLPTKYFEDIISNYTEKELIEEELLLEKSKLLDFIPRAIYYFRSLLDKVIF